MYGAAEWRVALASFGHRLPTGNKYVMCKFNRVAFTPLTVLQHYYMLGTAQDEGNTVVENRKQ